MKAKSMREKIQALAPNMSVEDIVANRTFRWEIFSQISCIADLMEVTELLHKVGIIQNGA